MLLFGLGNLRDMIGVMASEDGQVPSLNTILAQLVPLRPDRKERESRMTQWMKHSDVDFANGTQSLSWCTL